MTGRRALKFALIFLAIFLGYLAVKMTPSESPRVEEDRLVEKNITEKDESSPATIAKQDHQAFSGEMNQEKSSSFMEWLDNGGNPDIIFEDGTTLLMHAIDQECDQCIEALLDRNPDVNIVSKSGQTALSAAIIAGDFLLVKELVKRGAKLELYQNPAGYNLIMHAASTGQNKVLEEILPLKTIPINAQDQDGMTALMFASKEGFSDTVKLLLDHKSNKTLKNNKGESALDLARQFNHQSVIDLLN